MIRTENIHSLTDFRQNAADHLAHLAETGGVEVLTVNGEAKGVVMSPQTFDDLAEKVFQAEIAARIKQGMADVAAGRVVEGEQAMKEIAEKHGLKID